MLEVLLQVVVLDGPPDKLEYHAFQVEFQVKGSEQIHSLLWILDARFKQRHQ